jgi:phosphate transport system substrate-binding protein
MTLKSALRAATYLAVAALFVTPAAADKVFITSHDGKVSVVGHVVAVEDRKMTVDTAVGPLTFDYEAVTCDGLGCPTLPLDNVRTTAGVNN